MLTIHTVLFPTDDSRAAEVARPAAERFAQRHGATLHVLRVEGVSDVTDDRFAAAPAPSSGEGVVEARRDAASADDAIVDYAQEVVADLIVMGTHGRTGLDRVALGSTAEGVLRRAPCAVLTVSPKAAGAAVGPVLAPLAFESASDAGVETAAVLAESLGTSVVAVHVVEPITVPVPYMVALPALDTQELREQVESALATWVQPFGDRAPIATEVRFGDAAHQIVAAARDHSAGMIVQASHGRRGLSRWLLGSVSEAVVRRAPCPVLTLRTGARPLIDAPGPALAVPREDWAALFDALSRRVAGGGHRVSVEVVSPDAVGPLFRDAPLVGVTYDPRADTLDIAVTGAEHHVVQPFAIRSEAGAWAVEGLGDPAAPGPWTFDVVGAAGARERVTVRPVTEPVAA